MSALNNSHVIVLRRAPGSDPLASGAIDAACAVTFCVPVPVPVGSGLMDGGGHLTGLSTIRWRLDIDFLGFRRSGEDAYYQSYGRYVRMATKVLVGTPGSTLWLWRAYERGSNTNVPLDRDDFDVTDPETDDYLEGSFFNLSSSTYQNTAGGETYPYDPAGRLPLQIVNLDAAEPQRAGSLYTLSMQLWAADTIASEA